MASETYELCYFNSWARVDVIRMALELAGASYTFIQPTNWAIEKAAQKFGKVPRLTIKSSDGSTKDLWESFAIELYLGEKLGFLPKDTFKRAESISILCAQAQLREKIASTVDLPVDQREEAHKIHVAETIASFLKYHEAILAKSSGPYYDGQLPSLADLSLLSMYLRYKEMYGEKSPITPAAFPNVIICVEALLSTKVGEYVEKRRDGDFIWSNETFHFMRK